MATAPRDPREYELMAILLPDKSEEETSAMIQRIDGFISDIQGNVTETLTDSPWGRRRLAYTIRHDSVDYRDGFYLVVHFEAVPSMIRDLERELKLDTNVIRYLLVSDDPNAGEPEGAEGQIDEDAEGAETEPTRTPEQAPAQDAPTTEQTSTTESASAPESTPTTESEPAQDSAPADADTTEPAAESATEQVEDAGDNVEEQDEPAPADAPKTNESTTEE